MPADSLIVVANAIRIFAPKSLCVGTSFYKKLQVIISLPIFAAY